MAAVLLERESELAAIEAGLERARDGHGSLLLVEGAAGIGKSSLLAAARTLATERGLGTLTARGGELEREFPGGVARQLLGRDHGGPLHDTNADWALPADRDRSYAVLDALFWAVADLAEDAPLLLAIDDLQWVDVLSLRFLDYLARRVEDLPLVISAALREGEPGTDTALLDSLLAEPRTQLLRPKPLSEEAAATLVRQALSHEAELEFCRACHEATGGNPLLLRQLLRGLTDGGVFPSASNAALVAPAGGRAVARSVRQRLSRLPPDFVRLVEAAAVLGDGAGVRHAAELGELDTARAYEGIGVLAQAGILRAAQEVEFVHPVLREAIVAGIRPGASERLHARAARLLEDAGAPHERAAAHLLRSPPAGEARTVALLSQAAGHAIASGSVESAVAYLRRAMAEPPREHERGELALQLGSAERLIDASAGLDHLRHAVERLADPDRRALAARRLAWDLTIAGRTREAVEFGISELERLPDSEARRRLEAVVVTAAVLDPSLREVADPLIERLRADGSAHDVAARVASVLLAYRDARAGAIDSRAAESLLAEALVGGDGVLALDAAGGSFVLGGAVLVAADSELTLRLCEERTAAVAGGGSVPLIAGTKIVRAGARLARGETSLAAADAHEALRAIEAFGIRGLGPAYSATPLAHALMDRGELDAAAAALARASLDDGASGPPAIPELLDARARLSGLRGDAHGALDEAREAGGRFEQTGGRNPAFVPWRSRAALALAELGQERDARALAEDQLGLAHDWGAPRAVGRALIAAAMVDEADRRIDLLGEAVDVLDGSPARLELARALTHLGAALRRAGRRRAAREPLGRAMELAHACGAARLRERARDELVATGARPRRLQLSGPASLTPSELRVADLAAKGRSNREIARELVVTTKTVEAHLRAVYRKLDVGSRSQLPRALGDDDAAR